MKNERLEIENAIYTGICIYNRLSRTIVEIEDSFVSLDDKRELSLYLGILHSQNRISNILNETDLKNHTIIAYKKLDNNTYLELYNLYFKDIINNFNLETIEEFFKCLLTKDIVKSLNREYDFNMYDFINDSNKQLVKK